VFRDAVSGPRPGGPYSPGIVAEGRFVFVSGQGPVMNGVYADVFPDRSQRERPSKHSSASGASRSTALRWFQAIRH
jgi:hypothetical protein